MDLATLRGRVAGLALPPADTLLFGSAPMLLHGLLDEVGDIDLVVRGAAWERACRLGAVRRAPGGDRVVEVGAVALFDGWLGEDLDALFARAEEHDGLLVASLADVTAYKRRLDRPKDRLHLRLLGLHDAAPPDDGV